MNTMDRYVVAAATVTGARHRQAGLGNQDAFFAATRGERAVFVVCDGCGSAAASHVGAYVGARLVAEASLAMVGEADAVTFWREITAKVTSDLGALAAPLGDVLAEAFLFTTVGALVDRERLVLFALGDGVVGCNDEVVELGPFADNAPPYLAYRLLDGRDVTLQPVLVRDVASVERFFIGSDGAIDLPERYDDRFFAHPDALRRRLTQLSRPTATAPSVLGDDTTLITAKRSGPWTF